MFSRFESDLESDSKLVKNRSGIRETESCYFHFWSQSRVGSIAEIGVGSRSRKEWLFFSLLELESGVGVKMAWKPETESRFGVE